MSEQLVAISAPTADPDGHVWLLSTQRSAAGTVTRRASRVATLDGGAVVSDQGFSDADRTLDLRWTPTDSAQEAAVERLLRLYALVTVSAPAGVFSAAPASYEPSAGDARLQLLITARLSA